jgi:hypothetical protein
LRDTSSHHGYRSTSATRRPAAGAGALTIELFASATVLACGARGTSRQFGTAPAIIRHREIEQLAIHTREHSDGRRLLRRHD